MKKVKNIKKLPMETAVMRQFSLSAQFFLRLNNVLHNNKLDSAEKL